MNTLKRALRPGGILRLSARLLLLVLFLMTYLPAYAQEPGAASPAAPTLGIDDNALEVGVWYVNDYENCGGWGLGDLGVTDDDALALRNRLTSPFFFFIFPWPTPQWQAPITWGNGSAWEKDWTRSGAGGWENSQIDQVDLAYFSGHGASSGWFFGVGGNSRNDCQVTKNDTVNSLGDLDLDWMGVSACNVLDDPFSNYQGWANSMYGLRLFMGFKTVMSDVAFGDTLGWHLRWGRNFTQAWFWSADALLPSSQIARILAEDNAYFYDTYANHNSFTAYDNFFSWWTHQAGTPLAANAAAAHQQVNIAALNGEMPILQVAPFSTAAEQLGNFAQVANSFGLSSTTPISGIVASDIFGPLAGSQPMFASEDGSLVMDPSAGTYLYIDPNGLWSQQAVAATEAQAAGSTAIRAVGPEEALAVGEAFLNETGLIKPDGVLQGVGSDLLEVGEDPGRSNPNASSVSQARVVSANETNWKVNFGRQVDVALPISNSVGAAAVTQTFDVVGPGAKLAVYVDATAPATITSASELADATVMGGQGGWRRLLDVDAAGGQRLMATMLPTTTIETLFNLIGDKVALDNVPLAGTKEIINIDAGYYEGPMGMNLAELIPVYILTVRNTGDDPTNPNNVQDFDVYIPINAGYMAPYAEILKPAAGSVVPGASVALEAADASKTLAALGVDPSLDFALGSGGDYSYEWFLGSAGGQSLGTGRTANLQIPLNAIAAGTDGKPGEVKVVLVVTDLDKDSDPRVASDSVILAFSPVFLPAVEGQ